MSRRNRGQSIVEYAILLAVIIAALVIMQIFIKRGYQGGLKDSADKMGDQFSASGTTIHQNRQLLSNQVITEEVLTDSKVNTFKPAGLDSATGTIDKGAYSYTERAGGKSQSETKAKTESVDLETTRQADYKVTEAADYEMENKI